jgi:hypothetical protein
VISGSRSCSSTWSRARRLYPSAAARVGSSGQFFFQSVRLAPGRSQNIAELRGDGIERVVRSGNARLPRAATCRCAAMGSSASRAAAMPAFHERPRVKFSIAPHIHGGIVRENQKAERCPDSLWGAATDAVLKEARAAGLILK